MTLFIKKNAMDVTVVKHGFTCELFLREQAMTLKYPKNTVVGLYKNVYIFY